MKPHKHTTKTILDQAEKNERAYSPRHFLRYAGMIGLCALALSSPVHAQQREAAADATEPFATRIVVDEEANVIRFFIDGKEKARLNADGLQVRENLNYGGNLTDYGPSGFDDQVGMKEYERLKAEGYDAE